MKIGVIIETFRQPLRAGIELAAKLGCEGIQLYGISPEFNLLTASKEEVAALRRHAEDHGLAISAVCGDLPGHGYSNPAEVPTRVDNVKRLIDRSLELDCRVITNHIGVVPADPAHPDYPVMVKSLGEVARHAAAAGTVIAIETGPEPAEVLKRFLADVGSPGLGINLDPANFVMVLKADPAEAVRTLAGHIVHTHAKDGIHYQACDPAEIYRSFAENGFDALLERTGKLFEEVPLGEGQVDWDAYLAALRETGYDGFLTIEREVGPDPAKDIALAVEFLKEHIK